MFYQKEFLLNCCFYQNADMVHSSYARLVEKIQRVEDENKNLVKLVENLNVKNEKVSNINTFITVFINF